MDRRILIAYYVAKLLIGRWAAWYEARELHAEGKRCICGYELIGLELPRCPECGRAIGFDRTFEEMGIDPKEIRRRAEPDQSSPRQSKAQ